MSLYTVLLVLLVLVVIGALPTWGHSRNWGYGPSGGILGLVVVVVIIMFLMGRFVSSVTSVQAISALVGIPIVHVQALTPIGAWGAFNTGCGAQAMADRTVHVLDPTEPSYRYSILHELAHLLAVTGSEDEVWCLQLALSALDPKPAILALLPHT